MIDKLALPGRSRRDRHRDHAGRRFSRQPRLGLRRRQRCSPRTAAYGRPDDLKAFVDARASPRADGDDGRRLQPLRPGGKLPARLRAALLQRRNRTRRGVRRSTSMPKARRSCAASSSKTRSTGSNEFAMDGLRFDAVHAIEDRSQPDILEEIAETRAVAAAGRSVRSSGSGERQEPGALSRARRSGPAAALCRAVERRHPSCHARAADRRGAGLLRRLRRRSGAPSGPLPHRGLRLPERSVRLPRGRAARRGRARICRRPPSSRSCRTTIRSAIARSAIGWRRWRRREAVRAGLALLLLAPSPPLLFMGEEWASTQPFLFFCDLGEILRDAVREGRRKEFASFPEFADAKPGSAFPIPPPRAPSTASKLDWTAARDARRIARRWPRRAGCWRCAGRRSCPGLPGMSGHAGRIEWIGGLEPVGRLAAGRRRAS